MMLRDRDRDDRGFTLIELLVVIIIIGILAAIAIPVFLNQRQKGYYAGVRSDLRNLANFEEVYLNDFESYGTGLDTLTKEPKTEVSPGDIVEVLSFNGSYGYCLGAWHADDVTQTTPGPRDTVFYYDSLAGGLQKEGSGSCEAKYLAGGDYIGVGKPIPDATLAMTDGQPLHPNL
jgi:type IV pilus assembly protein PilA